MVGVKIIDIPIHWARKNANFYIISFPYHSTDFFLATGFMVSNVLYGNGDAFAKLVQHSISVAYTGRVLKTTLSFLLVEIIWPKECNIAAAFRKWAHLKPYPRVSN